MPIDLFKVLTSGAMIVGAKPIIEGAFSEWVKTITIAQAEVWITQDRSLWDELDPGWKETMINYGGRMGDLKFFTTEWALGIARQNNKGLTSLFLNWPEAMAWLDKNIHDLRERVIQIK